MMNALHVLVVSEFTVPGLDATCCGLGLAVLAAGLCAGVLGWVSAGLVAAAFSPPDVPVVEVLVLAVSSGCFSTGFLAGGF